jgi:hypothetical protein
LQIFIARVYIYMYIYIYMNIHIQMNIYSNPITNLWSYLKLKIIKSMEKTVIYPNIIESKYSCKELHILDMWFQNVLKDLVSHFSFIGWKKFLTEDLDMSESFGLRIWKIKIENAPQLILTHTIPSTNWWE